jgi:hypothetical protein
MAKQNGFEGFRVINKIDVEGRAIWSTDVTLGSSSAIRV